MINDVDGGLGGDARSAGGMGASPVVGGLDATPEALPDVLGRDSLVDRAPTPDVPMVMTCDVLTQNCGLSRGCYLDTSAQPVCTFAGDLGASAFCVEHRACLPGLLCVEAFGGGGGRTCQPACNPARDDCPGGMGCRKLAGTTIGFCEP